MSPRTAGLAIAAALALAMVPVFPAAAQAAAGPGENAAAAPVASFLFVGSYHMANHDRDVHNTRADDVLAAKRQQEIADLAKLVERYRPTKVMVEIDPSSQAKLDADFAASCKGQRPLGRDEVEQLGYRIACDLGLPGVVGVNWNELGPIADEASIDYAASIERHGQQAQRERDMALGNAQAAQDQSVLDHGSIGDMLRHLNSPAWLESNAHAYFRIGLYGTADDPAGANWMMLWQGRNLIIFNNIVRNTAPGDRVLVVYGAGHGNLLRQYAADSGFFRLEDTSRWLREEPAH
jgi:hypothetical protein